MFWKANLFDYSHQQPNNDTDMIIMNKIGVLANSLWSSDII